MKDICRETKRKREEKPSARPFSPRNSSQVPWEQGLPFHKTTSVRNEAYADDHLFPPKSVDE